LAKQFANKFASFTPSDNCRENMLSILSPDCEPVSQPPAPVSKLERILRLLSVLTMLMTVPQILTIWVGGNAAGVSLVSWSSYFFAACLCFVYGIQKRDKTIYLACVGWVLLDAAVVIGVIVHG
jgi:uncharacterized protein with PQ loop repeat